MDIQRISSYYAPTPSLWWKNDVFLSFRGEDTRLNFTSHLYNSLIRSGIHVFKDDKELESGKCIRPELFQAIEESRYLIIVFSKNYASSTWCLDELLKIAEGINRQQQVVIPIFFDVDPSVVRKQSGEFEKVFEKYEDKFKENKIMVQKWREALRKVADISGYDLKNRDESEVIQEIVEQISKQLNLSTSLISEGLVGLDSQLEELTRLIGTGLDVRTIGICGMGGIGKTTIARVIYDLISSRYEGSGFLANVGENSKNDKGMISLQKQLLHQTLKGMNINIFDVNNGINVIRRRLQHKKVLVILDDVTQVNQLNKLVGECDWFGSGSRIIITTRDKNLLLRVDQMYEAKLLNDDDALQLFCLNAFKKYQPPETFVELSKSVVQHCYGLPLALEVLGSFFFGKNVDVWKSALVRLSKEPADDIINRLKISYEGLGKIDKEIFLDIASFFNGKSCGYVKNILDACGFESTIGISTLIEKHLIKISKNDILWMHDLLQIMGREIVKRKLTKEPGRRSRLWEKNDICHVLGNNIGSEEVEGIMIKEDLNLSVGPKAFSKMINLRLLQIKNVQLPEGLDRLSNNLRLLEWHGYPLKSLPSSLELDKVFELKLHHSSIELLWKGTKQLGMLTSISLKNCHNLKDLPDLKCAPSLQELYIEGCPKLRTVLSHLQVPKVILPLKQLRSLRLKNCEKIVEIPDLTCFPNLSELYIHGCERLCRIHSPSLVHENLSTLQVRNCIGLKALPSKIHMKSLRYFYIVGCPELEKFSEIAGIMKDLRYIGIVGTAIRDMPLPDGLVPRLESLNLSNNNKLVTLPSTLSGLKSLSMVNLRGCSKLENVAETLGQVESLRLLYLNGTAITQPLSSTFSMKKLQMLNCCGCKASPSRSYFPSSLMARSSNGMALMLPSLIGSVRSLRILNLSDCNLGEEDIPCDFFTSLISLEELYLSSNNFISLPTTINCLSKLKCLFLNDCKRLQSLTELLPSTNKVDLNGCASLETLPGALELSGLECIKCFKLLGIKNLMFPMLKHSLKAPKERRFFRMVVPGDEIPEWVTYQGMGSSITMERPPNLHNKKLVGVVACCVFVVHKHLLGPNTTRLVEVVGHVLGDDGETWEKHMASIAIGRKGRNCLSEHLWLLYSDVIKYNRLEISFGKTFYAEVEVKRCGAHPIYEQDLNDFNPTTRSSSLGNLNESPQERFSGSEEPSNSDGVEPQPKGFKIFKFPFF